jgi:hypothetical protein
MLPEYIKDQRRWITPEPLNVCAELVGAPLATPARRALAMAIDVAVVGLLSGVSGLWLVAGLALVILQLRSHRGATRGRRLWIGWIGAALIALLAFQELADQWGEWRHRDAAPVADAAGHGAQAGGTAESATKLSDAERIAQLEAELAEARHPRALHWRDPLDRFIDEGGLGLGWGIVYFSLLPAWWGGQTLGKKLLRLRVVELTGKPMTVMRCLRRYGGYAAGLATAGLGFAQMIWDPNRQGIQDRTAHTAVIDLRAQRRPILAPPGPSELPHSAPPPA